MHNIGHTLEAKQDRTIWILRVMFFKLNQDKKERECQNRKTTVTVSNVQREERNSHQKLAIPNLKEKE
jgi:hypothetical protein